MRVLVTHTVTKDWRGERVTTTTVRDAATGEPCGEAVSVQVAGEVESFSATLDIRAPGTATASATEVPEAPAAIPRGGK